MTDGFYLSPEDRRLFQQLLNDYRQRGPSRVNPRSNKTIEDPENYFTPEVYVAEIPIDGIPATTVINDVKGAVCDIFRLTQDNTTGKFKIEGPITQRPVYNLGATAIPGYPGTGTGTGTASLDRGQFFLIFRDKLGTWWVDRAPISGGGSGAVTFYDYYGTNYTSTSVRLNNSRITNPGTPTYQIDSASFTLTGLVTTSTQSFEGQKRFYRTATFADNLILTNAIPYVYPGPGIISAETTDAGDGLVFNSSEAMTYVGIGTISVYVNSVLWATIAEATDLQNDGTTFLTLIFGLASPPIAATDIITFTTTNDIPDDPGGSLFNTASGFTQIAAVTDFPVFNTLNAQISTLVSPLAWEATITSAGTGPDTSALWTILDDGTKPGFYAFAIGGDENGCDTFQVGNRQGANRWSDNAGTPVDIGSNGGGGIAGSGAEVLGGIIVKTGDYRSAILQTTAPTSNSSPGEWGDVASDGTYFYFCISQNTWVRCLMTAPW